MVLISHAEPVAQAGGRLPTVPALVLVALGALGIPVAGGTAAAQERGPRAPVATRVDGGGWLGLGIEWTLSGRGDDASIPRISRVLPGSPAERAGLRTGDEVVGLEGRSPVDPSVLRSVLTGLRPGDEVLVRVRREGRSLDLRVQAGSRPATLPAHLPRGMAIRIDSLTATVLRDLDSIRLVPHAGRYRIRGGRLSEMDGRAPDGIPLGDGVRIHDGIVLGGGDAVSLLEDEVGRPMPFSVFLVESGRAEGLRHRMKEITDRLTSVERQREILEREAAVARDPALRATLERIEAQAVQLRAIQEELGTRLRQVADEELRSGARVRETRVRARRAAEGSPPRLPRATRVEVRPLTPYIVGRDFLAGAEIVPLNDRLGRYFGVEEGVLVTRVVDGTPAREAGLLAGDVIIRVGNAGARSSDDLRRLLGTAERAELTVVREGERIRLRLPR